MENQNNNMDGMGPGKIPVSPQIKPETNPNSSPTMSEPVKMAPPIAPMPSMSGPTAPITPKAEPKLNFAPSPASKSSKLPLYITLGVIALGGFGGGAYWYLANNAQLPVMISTGVSGYNLMIDGQEYRDVAGPYSTKLKKGTYTITATKPGYTTETTVIQVAGGKDNNVTLALREKKTAEMIIQKNILFPAYNRDGNSLMYFAEAEDGYHLYEYALATNTEVRLSSKPIGSVLGATWSATRQQVAVLTENKNSDTALFPYLDQYPAGTQLNWVITLTRSDLTELSVKPLNPGVKNLSFSPEGDKIVYIFDNGKDQFLSQSQSDGANFENIIKIERLKNPMLSWSPDGNRVAMYASLADPYARAGKAEASDVYTYDFSTRSVTQLSQDGSGYGAVWSPDGSKLVFETGNTLSAYDFGSKSLTDLKVQASVHHVDWTNNDKVIVINQNGAWEDGQELAIDAASLPQGIRAVINAGDSGSVLIVNESGIYSVTR